MSDSATVKNQLISWLRQGLAAGIVAPPDFDQSDNSHVSVKFAVQVQDRDQKEIYAGDAPEANVQLYGPGDVVGIDPNQIIRVEPRNGTADFEPNYFPLIEFYRPDFPWLFSPFSHDVNMRLQPWLCLIAVKKGPGATLTVDPNRPLPVLTIEDPSSELPDLSESWAWTHAQIATSSESPLTAEAVAATLAESPELAVSRLICPRKLEANTSYLACVVPTFKVGVLAGLGQELTDDNLSPAWESLGNVLTEPLMLPVYYHWEFSTTISGSFESLVRQLEPRELTNVGSRNMTVTVPPNEENGAVCLLGYQGVLISPNVTTDAWSAEESSQFQDSLKSFWETQSARAEAQLAPPVYGSMHATNTSAYQDPVWEWELNFDPRWRAAAGWGTQVVQRDQEELMASAWEQAGDVRGANRALRQGQLARELGRRLLRKHFTASSFGSLLQITHPVHTFLHLRGWVARSPALAATTAPAFRRIARRRGLIGRRVFGSTKENSGAIVSQIKDNLLELPSAFFRFLPPAGSVLMNGVTLALAPKAPFLIYRSFLLSDIDDAPGWNSVVDEDPRSHWPVPPHTVSASRDRPPYTPQATGSPVPPGRAEGEKNLDLMNENFKQAFTQHQFYLRRVAQLARRSSTETVAALTGKQKDPLDKLRPEKTVLERMKARLKLPSLTVWDRPEPLAPLTMTPTFPYAMCEPLKEVAEELFAPGLETVPPNTIGILIQNRSFIEAYMVGLNHELSREMLWREYPAERDETYFQYFWTTPPKSKLGAPEPLPDIPSINQWLESQALGQNVPAGTTPAADSLVLLIRGEVLRRYPTASVCAVPAIWSGNQRLLSENPPPIYPSFRGRLEPDITYLGFDLTVAKARGSPLYSANNPGWFFVFQEQPVEPRFGLNVAGSGGDQSSWSNLSWSDVELTDGGTHLRLNSLLAGVDDDREHIAWGVNAAHMAFITTRLSFRIAVHADTMLLADN